MKFRRGKEFDLIMSHKEAREFVDERGYAEFIDKVDEEFNRGLSSSSVHWKDDDTFICKMRGAEGDVIIGWEENHAKKWNE